MCSKCPTLQISLAAAFWTRWSLCNRLLGKPYKSPSAPGKKALKEKTLKSEQSHTTQAANFRQLANAASWETCCPTVCGLLDDSFQGAVVILSHWPFKMGTPGKREVWSVTSCGGKGCPIWKMCCSTPETNRPKIFLVLVLQLMPMQMCRGLLVKAHLGPPFR